MINTRQKKEKTYECVGVVINIPFMVGTHIVTKYLRNRFAGKVLQLFTEKFKNKPFNIKEAISNVSSDLGKREAKIAKSVKYLKDIDMIKDIGRNKFKVTNMADYVENVIDDIKGKGTLKKRHILKSMKRNAMNKTFSMALFEYMKDKQILQEVSKNMFDVKASVNLLTYHILRSSY